MIYILISMYRRYVVTVGFVCSCMCRAISIACIGNA